MNPIPKNEERRVSMIQNETALLNFSPDVESGIWSRLHLIAVTRKLEKRTTVLPFCAIEKNLSGAPTKKN